MRSEYPSLVEYACFLLLILVAAILLLFFAFRTFEIRYPVDDRLRDIQECIDTEDFTREECIMIYQEAE